MSKTTFLTSLCTINDEVRKHSPAILTVLGLAGMVTTVVMACKVTPKANDILEDLHEKQAELEEKNSTAVQVFKDVKAVTPVYLPSILMGTVSAACILGSYSIGTKRTAALATAYDISQRTLRTYQDKVIETIGERKEEKIRDEIAKDKIVKNPPVQEEIIGTGDGNMLFLDAVTGRYFRSTVDTIRKAESLLNRRLYTEMYVSLNDFYDEINLPHCGIGDDVGWNVDNELDFYFSSQLTQNNEACHVLEYDICPRYDYRNLM